MNSVTGADYLTKEKVGGSREGGLMSDVAAHPVWTCKVKS